MALKSWRPEWWRTFFLLDRPFFGQITLWVLFWSSLGLFRSYHQIPMSTSNRANPVTFLFWVPIEIVTDPVVYGIFRWGYLIGLVLWFFQVGIPWSSWLTAISFTFFSALTVENFPGGSHALQVTNMLLILHASWYHFHRVGIRESLRSGTFWSTSLYPRWIYLLSLFYLGWFHTLSGLTKLRWSGLGWIDGVSMQLWVRVRGLPSLPYLGHSSPLYEMILEERWFAMLGQGFALVVETFSILAFFSRRFRPWVGVLLLGFYACNILLFDFGRMFRWNFVIVLFFFLPFEESLTGWVGRLQARFRRGGARATEAPTGRSLRRALLARFDLLGLASGASEEGKPAQNG